MTPQVHSQRHPIAEDSIVVSCLSLVMWVLRDGVGREKTYDWGSAVSSFTASIASIISTALA
jgi:hypothetical protein